MFTRDLVNGLNAVVDRTESLFEPISANQKVGHLLIERMKTIKRWEVLHRLLKLSLDLLGELLELRDLSNARTFYSGHAERALHADLVRPTVGELDYLLGPHY